MKKTTTIILGLSASLLMTGCSESAKQSEEVKSYAYSTEQVYTQMCVKCHGEQGEGIAKLAKNGKPKGPAINDQELYELKLSLTDIKNGGLNQSSGSDHEVMGHNAKAIVKKGMDYDSDAMAKYIYDNFHK